MNTGINANQIPTLGTSGILQQSVIPTPNSLFVCYTGTVQIVNNLEFVKWNTNSSIGSGYTINTDGTITVKQSGIYYGNYSVTATNTQLIMCLSFRNGNILNGSYAASSSSIIPVHVSMGIIMSLNANDVIGIKNVSGSPISISPHYAGFSIFRMGS